MLPSIEQISEASKANGEAWLAMLNAFTQTAFDSVAELAELNLNVAKTSLAESVVVAQQLLSARK